MRSEPKPDCLLVQAIKDNDVSAFDSIYWKYQDRIFANILKLIKNPEISKDILQEVFILLWVKRDMLKPEMNIAGWLFTTSYNKSIDFLRISAKEYRVVNEVNLLNEISDKEIELERELWLSAVQQAICHLSPQKRKVFESCKIKGMSYEETALELNISKHTVKEYLSAAVVQIRNHIRNYYPQIITSVFWILFFSRPPHF